MSEKIIGFKPDKDFEEHVKNWKERGVPDKLSDKILENLNNPKNHEIVGT